MPHGRPPIPVTLTLLAEPPAQAESDALLITVDALIGEAKRAA